MTAFVESCVETVAGSAVAAERRARGRPRAKKLLALLAGKRNILVTTHQHPDPDALGSGMGMCTLLADKLPAKTSIHFSIKGRIGGGVNDAFIRNSHLKLLPWTDAALGSFDAIILLDTQPQFNFSPLPPGMMPLAVIDHHRGRGRKPDCAFSDIRTDAGATASIIFSYFMELEVPIPPDLGATLLFAIESDLAGAAGTPGELDNVALSSLTLLADPRKLYQMRYVDLPQSYYIAYYRALQSAVFYENALMSHLGVIDSLEKPAVMGDFLMRFDKVQWALVTACTESKLILSLRTSSARSAADVMRRILRKLGEGGGHRTKGGGYIDITGYSQAEVDNLRKRIWNRYLRALGMKPAKGQRLVPEGNGEL
jgi:nanoRNase/pAp phosphatase (c-di-AMP/oligoRNAs hydrolase)